jgi:hypothetical protein
MGSPTYVVEVAPAKPAENGKPAVGPEYRYVYYLGILGRLGA